MINLATAIAIFTVAITHTAISTVAIVIVIIITIVAANPAVVAIIITTTAMHISNTAVASTLTVIIILVTAIATLTVATTLTIIIATTAMHITNTAVAPTLTVMIILVTAIVMFTVTISSERRKDRRKVRVTCGGRSTWSVYKGGKEKGMGDIVTCIKLDIATAGITGVCPLASDNATFTATCIIFEAVSRSVVSTVIAVGVILDSTTVAVWPVRQGGHMMLAQCRVRR